MEDNISIWWAGVRLQPVMHGERRVGPNFLGGRLDHPHMERPHEGVATVA